ncbi:hypothetical protein HPB49_013133 [Dermacentor silvarum]|uniref:Uncharacterized protein n=1 Tax=Dermacentor silvarum TaxID=543639 RepID=A0ACB8D5R5_DERSI|nr:hypothetical protein HPB49_013133 [Dermacentor silvarum]
MPSIMWHDRCWTIPIVAAGCAFVSLFTTSSYGLMFILFMEEFDISHEQAAWPQSTHAVVGNCAGLLLSVLQQKLTVYHITLISAILTSTGLIASSFAPDIIWRTVLLGGVYGTGSGMLITSLSLYTLVYFEKYRATATAFKYTGYSLSGIVGPSLMGYLADNFSCKASLLLAGAISAHAIPLLMLLKNPRPVNLPVFCRKNKASVTAEPDQSGAPFQSTKAASLSIVPIMSVEPCRKCAKEETTVTSSCGLTHHSFTEIAEKHIGNKLHPATNEIENEKKPPASVKDKSLPDDRMARRCPDDGRYGEPLVVNAPNFLAHCGMLLSSGTFYTLLVSYVMIEYVANMHEMTIVEYGVDKNVATLKQCNQLQTFNAVGQLTGRLVVPFLSDKLSFNRCAFTSAILALTAACFVLTAAANNYVTLALLTVAAGICEGYLICIRVVLAAEYLGVESIGLCFGFEGICMMPVAFSAPALIV